MSKKEDEDLDYLEKEFLKCKLEDIPLPIDEIEENLEEEVLEVMKSGCNLQIAEYVILKYQDIEDDLDGKQKLLDFKKNYQESKNEYFNDIINNKEKKINDINLVKDYITKKYSIKENNQINIFDQVVDGELRDYVDEIKKYLKNYKDNEDNKDNKIKSEKDDDLCERTIKYIIYKNLYIENSKDNDEKTKKFFEEREKYIKKRESVVEACLRNVKKIVNDEKEYNKYYKEYKEYKEKMKNKKEDN